MTTTPMTIIGDPTLCPTGFFSNRFDMDASGDKIGAVFVAHKTGTITGIGINIEAKDGTHPTYDVRLETVAAGGEPSGTLATTNSNKQITAGDTVLGWQIFTLTASHSVTKGDHLAINVEYVSGTVDASNNIRVRVSISTDTLQHSPFSLTNTGSWTQSNAAPILCAIYSDGEIPYGMMPFDGAVLVRANFDSADTPDEKAALYTPPANVALAGAWIWMDRVSSTADFDIVVYDSDGTTPLETRNYNVDLALFNTNSPRLVKVRFPDIALTSGGGYRIAIKPTSATQTLAVAEFLFDTLAHLEHVMGEVYLSTRANAGSWTDFNSGTFRGVSIWPVLAEMTFGGGGGGVIKSAGNGGGMVG